MPTHPLLQIFLWAVVRMDPVNIPAKLKSVALVFPEIIATEVLGRVANRNLTGLGMVLFETVLVGSYRPSIVSYPPSLRISETLPLFYSSTPLFPTTPLVSPKFPQRRCLANCPCRAISFQDFQPMWSVAAPGPQNR